MITPGDNLALAAFSRAVRTNKSLSRADVCRGAAKRGLKISVSYIAKIEEGLVINPSRKKLAALAAGLDVIGEELFAVARGEEIDTPTVQESMLLKMFRELPELIRGDLYEIARCLYKRHHLARSKNKNSALIMILLSGALLPALAAPDPPPPPRAPAESYLRSATAPHTVDSQSDRPRAQTLLPPPRHRTPGN
jgi:transcriptional regulator with XRE-family HTH domain